LAQHREDPRGGHLRQAAFLDAGGSGTRGAGTGSARLNSHRRRGVRTRPRSAFRDDVVRLLAAAVWGAVTAVAIRVVAQALTGGAPRRPRPSHISPSSWPPGTASIRRMAALTRGAPAPGGMSL